MSRRRNCRFAFLLTAGLLLLLLCGCGAGNSKTEETEVYTRLDQLENKRIGVTTGSVQAMQAEARFPEAEIYFFSSGVDCLAALRTGKIDALLKATAVVGYIAVQDLTKMGDIVRSRTYEPFFPLIAITVIYFLLAGLIIRVIERLIGNIDPKKRKPEQILKGVETHD